VAGLDVHEVDMRVLELPDLNCVGGEVGLFANAARGVVCLTCSSPTVLVLVDFEEEEEEEEEDEDYDEDEEEEMEEGMDLEEEEDDLVEVI